jgi:membrane protein YqaA with SNARE-associated domain
LYYMSDTDERSEFQAVDETGDPVAVDDEEDPRNEPIGPRVGPNGREVVVPLRLYKTVTALSTLGAIVTYLVGFVLLDAATLQVSVVRRLLRYLLGRVGIGIAGDVLTGVLAVAAVGSILLGTAVYVLGTRFRAQGMGKAQEDSSEG